MSPSSSDLSSLWLLTPGSTSSPPPSLLPGGSRSMKMLCSPFLSDPPIPISSHIIPQQEYALACFWLSPRPQPLPLIAVREAQGGSEGYLGWMREGLQGLESRVGVTQEWRCNRTFWEECGERQVDR